MMGDTAHPLTAEPDTLRGELIERCTVLIDSALGGSTYSVAILANALRDYAPSLIPSLMERCARARRRRH